MAALSLLLRMLVLLGGREGPKVGRYSPHSALLPLPASPPHQLQRLSGGDKQADEAVSSQPGGSLHAGSLLLIPPVPSPSSAEELGYLETLELHLLLIGLRGSLKKSLPKVRTVSHL